MILNAKIKRILYSFKQFINQIFKDAMLFMICLAPVLYILFIKYAIPLAEEYLIEYIDLQKVISPYYLILDLLLVVLTPTMFSFSSAMVILGEIDDGITKYMSVTPVGTEGYLISRIILPLVLSMLVTIIALSFFSITKIKLINIIILSLMSSMLGYIMCILVISLSTNKVEGMAVMKLSGILLMGIPIPFFNEGNVQYLASFLPSLWLTKFAVENNIIYLNLYLLVSVIWISVLTKKFKRKLFFYKKWIR